jgi:hypothetical protein
MDVSTVSAVVATAMLSGGGAGYLVSMYKIRVDSKDRNEELRLEREKFDHERSKYESERAMNFQFGRSEALARVRRILEGLTKILNDLPNFVNDYAPDVDVEDLAKFVRLKTEFIDIQDEVIYSMRELIIYHLLTLSDHVGDASRGAAAMLVANDEDEFIEGRRKCQSAHTTAHFLLGKALADPTYTDDLTTVSGHFGPAEPSSDTPAQGV